MVGTSRPGPSHVACTRKTLLIVEDSDFNRDLLVQIFEDAYEIELAADGPSALDVAAAKRPDLILMDIGLPGMSGLEVVRAIRVRASMVPIIAVSACVMPGDRERAIEAGCDDFVAKPVDDATLVETVARHLDRE
jgi:two-component system, cell cycle response regulator DivK